MMYPTLPRFTLLVSLFGIVSSTPQIGNFHLSDLHPWFEPAQLNIALVDIACRSLGPNPDIALGITDLSQGYDLDLLANSYVSSVNRDGSGFALHLDAWGSTTIPYASVGWFGVPAADMANYQIGTWSENVGSLTTMSLQNALDITFTTPFALPPNIVVFVSTVGQLSGHNNRFTTYPDNISQTGFTLHMNSWADTQMVSAGVTWVAIPQDAQHVASGTDDTWRYRSWDQPSAQNGRYVTFKTPFASTPQVFIAIQSFDVDTWPGFRLRASATAITTTGFQWQCDEWEGYNDIYGAGVSWIAFL